MLIGYNIFKIRFFFQNFYLFCCKPPDGSLLHLIQNLLFTNFAALLE
ncbi:hypothetical protein HMPREF0239_01204 [Clostridium sp. ATCC BAA-442]|nr:hypothetical protein HMPREF0239_01204 [Clostridium sp. ATCC BAA-442]